MSDQNQSVNQYNQTASIRRSRMTVSLGRATSMNYLPEVVMLANNRELLNMLNNPTWYPSLFTSESSMEAITWELGRRMVTEPETSQERAELETFFQHFNRLALESQRAHPENGQPHAPQTNPETRSLVKELDICLSGYVYSFVGIRETLERYRDIPLPSEPAPELVRNARRTNEKYNEMVKKVEIIPYRRGGASFTLNAKVFPNFLATIEAGLVLDAIDRNPELEKAVTVLASMPLSQEVADVAKSREDMGRRLTDALISLPDRITPSEYSSQMRKRVTEVFLHMLDESGRLDEKSTICSGPNMIRALKEQSHKMPPGEFDQVVINFIKTNGIGPDYGRNPIKQFLEELYGPQRRTLPDGQGQYSPVSESRQSGGKSWEFAPLHAHTLAENRKTVAELVMKHKEQVLLNLPKSVINSWAQEQKDRARTPGKAIDQHECIKSKLKHYITHSEPEAAAEWYTLMRPLLSQDDRASVWFYRNARINTGTGTVPPAEQKFRDTVIAHMNDNEIIAFGRQFVKEKTTAMVKGAYRNFTNEDVVPILKRLASDLNHVPPDAEPPARDLIRNIMGHAISLEKFRSPEISQYAQPLPEVKWTWQDIESVINEPQLPSRLTLPDAQYQKRSAEHERKGETPVALQYFPRTSQDSRLHAANVAEYLMRRAPMEDEAFLKHVSDTLPWVETQHLLSRLEKEEVQSAIHSSPRMAAIVGFELLERKNASQIAGHDVKMKERMESLIVQCNEILKPESRMGSMGAPTPETPEMSPGRGQGMNPGRMPFRGPGMY